MIEEIKPKDLVAIVAILGILIYKAAGYNGGFDSLVSLIIGYYFAKRVIGTDNGV